MTMIISMTCPEGIVMAAERRMKKSDAESYIDNTKKLFKLSKLNIGISFTAKGIPFDSNYLTGVISNFEKKEINGNESIFEVRSKLLEYLKNTEFTTEHIIHICGFEAAVSLQNLKTIHFLNSSHICSYVSNSEKSFTKPHFLL